MIRLENQVIFLYNGIRKYEGGLANEKTYEHSKKSRGGGYLDNLSERKY